MQNTEKDMRKYIAEGWFVYPGTAFFGGLFLFSVIQGIRGNAYVLPALFILGGLAALASIHPIQKIRMGAKYIFGKKTGENPLPAGSEGEG